MRQILYILRQFGLDPIKMFRAFKNLFHYILDRKKFLALFPKKPKLKTWPSLQDFEDTAGSADGHYFWQDLICAIWITEENPKSHFDIGSRIDGFIAHLLTSREVLLLDIRPMKRQIPNLRMIQGDVQQGLDEFKFSFESVSSLHSIEHFGLGRYGDPLDPAGHTKGLMAISNCVKLGGSLYVSFPIGVASIEFNSQRIMDPVWPIEALTDFTLEKFVLIPWKGEPIHNTSPLEIDLSIVGQAGLYKFKRIKQ